MDSRTDSILKVMKSFQKRSKVEYKAVHNKDPDFETTDTEHYILLRDGKPSHKSICILSWATTSIFALLSLYLFLDSRSHSTIGNYEDGWATDFGKTFNSI